MPGQTESTGAQSMDFLDAVGQISGTEEVEEVEEVIEDSDEVEVEDDDASEEVEEESSSEKPDQNEDDESESDDGVEEDEDDKTEDTAGEDEGVSSNEKLMNLINTMTAAKTPAVVEKDVKGDELEELFPESFDLDEVFESKENFSKFIHQVIAHTLQKSQENLSTYVPSVVGNQVKQQQALQTVVNDYFNLNSDLSAVRPFVGQVANMVAQEDPKKSVVEVLNEAGKRTREALGLKGSAKVSKKSTKTKSKKTSSLPKSSSGGRKAPKVVSKIQSQINELIDL